MQQSVPRGNKKPTAQPVIITTDTGFTPKISDRTIRRRKEAIERLLNPSKYASGLDLCGVICLYIFLILAVLIGGGGIAVSIVYYNTSSSTTGWKIAGIVLGAITCIIGVILILLTIFKQSRNRPWRYKKTEKPINTDGYFDDDDEEMHIENLNADQAHDNLTIHRESQGEINNSRSQSANNEFLSDSKTREMATSPILDPSNPSSQLKTLNSDMIFCPGCNRLHPSTHQCMYSTRIANGFAVPLRTIPQSTSHGITIAIQTEDNIDTPKIGGPHTVIDRKLKYSNTTETQTTVTAKPSSNITESIILRRVPIPTAKVVIQQPTTKVMIVKVPNTGGQLIIQPKTFSFNEQPK